MLWNEFTLEATKSVAPSVQSYWDTWVSVMLNKVEIEWNEKPQSRIVDFNCIWLLLRDRVLTRLISPTFGQCRIWPSCRRSSNERLPVSWTRTSLRTAWCLVTIQRTGRNTRLKQPCTRLVWCADVGWCAGGDTVWLARPLSGLRLRRSRYPAAWTRSRIWCDEHRARVK